MNKLTAQCLGLFLFFPGVAMADPCGKVLLARGEVEVIAKRSAHLIQAGQSLDCGDIVVSRNGAATIEIAGGKLVIGTYSRLEIADVQKNKSAAEVNALNLIYGKTRVLIQKKRATRFEVRTPSATAGVRGTDFFISHDPAAHVSHEATIEGQVEVAKFESTEEPILVSAGSQVDVSIEPEEKDKALQPKPISTETKEQIRQASGVAKDDPDFTHNSAVKTLGNPLNWETGGLEDEDEIRHRITVGIGPVWNMTFHNTSTLDGQVASGHSVQFQYEQALKKNIAGWNVGLQLGEAKDRGENSYGVRNQYSWVDITGGVRMDFSGWWSPYAKVGVRMIKDRISISRPDLNYFVDRDDKGITLVAALGLDAHYSVTRLIGVFGKVEAELGQTLLTTESSVRSYNSGATSEPDQAGGNGVRGTSFGLSLLVGVMGQF